MTQIKLEEPQMSPPPNTTHWPHRYVPSKTPKCISGYTYMYLQQQPYTQGFVVSTVLWRYYIQYM